jgi:hypothetical protein
MQWLIAALVLVVILRAALVLMSLNRRGGESPYIRYVSLFSPAETAFLQVLDRAVGGRYRIFAKTRIADIVDVRQDLDWRTRRNAFNRICAKHFDFVLCKPRDFTIVGIIELNDSSHLRKERALRDAFVIDICNAISLPILMVRTRGQYSAFELRSVIKQAFCD